MRTWAWLVPAALGLALMLQSYDRLLKGDPDAPWATGFLCIGEGGAARPWELGSRLSARLRYLPASELVQAMLKGLGATKPETKAVLDARLRSKLVELPADAMRLLADRLREGRLPEAGKDEAVSGSQAPAEDHLSIAGRTLKVVGVLQPSVALFADSYLILKHPSSDALFPEGDSAVQPVEIIDLKAADIRNQKTMERVSEAFPGESFVLLGSEVRSEPKGFALFW